MMNRNEALELINDLYGLEASYVEAVIEALGQASLSDDAVIWIANKQLDEEQRRGQWLEQVAAYQDQHPHLGWQTCEENIRIAVR